MPLRTAFNGKYKNLEAELLKHGVDKRKNETRLITEDDTQSPNPQFKKWCYYGLRINT